MGRREARETLFDAEFLGDVRAAFADTLVHGWRAAAQSEGILSKIRPVSYDHGLATALVDVEGIERRSQMEELGTTFEIPKGAMENGDVTAFRRAIDQGVVALRKSLTDLLLKRSGEAADASGNSIDMGGQPLDGRALCDMLERMDIEFEDGQARMPAFVFNPTHTERFRELLDDPAVKLRMDVIVREKWMARYTLKFE